MPSLHDLAIDLINDAKALKNIPAKLYNLEQVKEITFHRDTSILSELAPDVINSFMVERSGAIRKFLISFAADWLMVDFSAAVPLSLSMFGFLLASESGDGPLRQISTELTKMYDRIVMHITGLPVKARASGPNVADPKSYWGSLRTIVSRLIDMISSDRSEHLRAQSLKLAENMILFGLPAEKLSSDPRLAKSRPQSGDSSKGLSAGDIPLHHPFINRNDLEQEAESIFSKMLLWASKGGPQGHPFSPAQMALLGEEEREVVQNGLISVLDEISKKLVFIVLFDKSYFWECFAHLSFLPDDCIHHYCPISPSLCGLAISQVEI
jgi:Symplekin/PTA1 N-terminal